MDIPTLSFASVHRACRTRLLFLVMSLCPLVVACSATQVQPNSALVEATDSTATYVLANTVIVTAPMMADSVLKAGTSWRLVGTLDEGLVYRTRDQVVAVYSFNMFEAYIVIDNAKVIGYYLPLEKNFVRSDPVAIELNRED